MQSSISLAFWVFYHAFQSQKTCFFKNVFFLNHVFVGAAYFWLVGNSWKKKTCVFACFFLSHVFVFFMFNSIFFSFSFTKQNVCYLLRSLLAFACLAVVAVWAYFLFVLDEVWVECFVQVRQLSFWQLLDGLFIHLRKRTFKWRNDMIT